MQEFLQEIKKNDLQNQVEFLKQFCNAKGIIVNQCIEAIYRQFRKVRLKIMLKEKISFERKKAILLTVDFSGTVEDYAMAWLKLTNNAREYKNTIWKIENCSGNNVYVYCDPKSVELVKDFCEGIYVSYHEDDEKMHYVGKVISEEEVTVGVPIYEWESTCKVNNPQWEKDCDNSISNWMPVDYE